MGKVATSDTVTKLTIYKDLQDGNWLCHMENFATNNKVLFFFSCPFSIQLLDKTEGEKQKLSLLFQAGMLPSDDSGFTSCSRKASYRALILLV